MLRCVTFISSREIVIETTLSEFSKSYVLFRQSRLLRKISNGEGKPKITKIVSTSLDKVAETVWKVDGETGQKYTGSASVANTFLLS